METRLSDIPTEWTEVLLHARLPASSPKARDSQQVLWQIYGAAIRRYLAGAIRDDQEVDNIIQEVAARLAEGRFATLDRSRGQFRTYLKRVLSNLIKDHFKRKARLPRGFEPELHEQACEDSFLDVEYDVMMRHLREEVLSRCWLELQAYETAKGKPYYSLLNYKLRHEGCSSREMAEALAETLGGPRTDLQIRKLVYRARRRFAHLIIDSVEQTLAEPCFAALEEEIIALDLHRFVGAHLAERRKPASGDDSRS